jgi:arylsulfatase A-like enzyme
LSRPAAVLLALGLLASGCTGDGARAPAEIGAPGTPLARSNRPPCRNLNELVVRVKRGYVPQKGTQISFIPREPNYVGRPKRPAHSGPWDYLARVPLVVYGPGIVKSSLKLEQHATMADLAPTTAELIGFEDSRRATDESSRGPSSRTRPDRASSSRSCGMEAVGTFSMRTRDPGLTTSP